MVEAESPTAVWRLRPYSLGGHESFRSEQDSDVQYKFTGYYLPFASFALNRSIMCVQEARKFSASHSEYMHV